MTKAHPHRQVNVHLDTVDDADVIERITAQPSMVGYVRELVRRDIHDERLDCVALKTSKLQSENAKLREAVKRMHEHIRQTCGECDGWYCSNFDEDNECCVFDTLAHELGVEVASI